MNRHSSPLKSAGAALLVVTLAIAFTANCGGGTKAEDDGSGASGSGASGSGASGSGGLSAGVGGSGGGSGDGLHCVGIDQVCESSVECCGGRRCEDDGGGTRRCIDESVCAATGATCTRASACCSLSCDGTCQGDGSVCKPVGTDCAADSECCSNDCQGTCQSIGEACAPLGELCSNAGFDQNCCSKNCENLGSEDAPDLRCARSSTCGARGEVCGAGSDCCSGVCLDGRCPTQSEVNGSLFAGEPCQKDADCSSYACASTVPGGPKTCQFLGGCRPAGEICSASWQCCSNILLLDGSPGNMCQDEGEGTGCVPHAIEGLATCDLQEGPKEVGEICEDTEGNKVHECCPTPNCEETLTGVWRCAGPGGTDECRPDGDSCQTADQCCSKICSPVETEDGVVLRCGPCVLADGLCTTNSDCCGGICTDGTCDDGETTCVPLTGDCTENSDCCSGICRNGSCATTLVR